MRGAHSSRRLFTDRPQTGRALNPGGSRGNISQGQQGIITGRSRCRTAEDCVCIGSAIAYGTFLAGVRQAPFKIRRGLASVGRRDGTRRSIGASKMLSQATNEKGLLIVNTGTGKCKSSSAFGMGLRAVGHGMKLGVVQFIKGAQHSLITAADLVSDVRPVKHPYREQGVKAHAGIEF